MGRDQGTSHQRRCAFAIGLHFHRGSVLRDKVGFGVSLPQITSPREAEAKRHATGSGKAASVAGGDEAHRPEAAPRGAAEALVLRRLGKHGGTAHPPIGRDVDVNLHDRFVRMRVVGEVAAARVAIVDGGGP